MSIITDEDDEFIIEVMNMDGTEFGEYLNALYRFYDHGHNSCQMSEEFKSALENELKKNIDWAKENIEIVEYTVVPPPSKRRTIKFKDEE